MSNDLVISSRIRLARNIEGYPFSLNDERGAGLIKSVAAKLKKIDNFSIYKMAELNAAEAVAMMERHLISPDLIKNKKYGAAAVSQDESVSIMLNEEDHIREQCILKGFSLREAYNKISLIDRTLAGEIKFSYDSKQGYITVCPTNLGTGMRASVMMFLPALSLADTLAECIEAASRQEMTVRGVYGEGSEPDGFIYQISNRRSLNITEEQIINSVESAVKHIIKLEINAREFLFNTKLIELKDRIMRAYGILSNCYLLSHAEFLHLCAFIKLGIYYKLLKNADPVGLEELILETGPANLSLKAQNISASERDVLRAKIVKTTVKRTITPA